MLKPENLVYSPLGGSLLTWDWSDEVADSEEETWEFSETTDEVSWAAELDCELVADDVAEEVSDTAEDVELVWVEVASLLELEEVALLKLEEVPDTCELTDG